MKEKKLFFLSLLMLFFLAEGTTGISCNKIFDEPPLYEPPAIIPTLSIAQLKAMHTNFGSVDEITTENVIEGVVIANDSSGNFYKQIIIQDTTGGIVVQLDGYDLYTLYPVGRQVFIKVKGLALGDYNNLIQLGYDADNSGKLSAISSQLFDKYIIKGSLNNTIVPKAVTVGQLNDSYQSTLIKLDSFEFNGADTSKTYANAVTKASVNLTINNCINEKIALRTSGYASFAGFNVANGNGTMLAVYSIYGTTKQLFIRDTSDVRFYNTRCDGSGVISGNTIFSEDFSNAVANADIDLPGWINVSETGEEKFYGSLFNSNVYAKISAYSSNAPVIKTWLITPAINLTGVTNPILNFETLDAFDNGATLKAYISTDYTGSETPWVATWTLLPATISNGHATSYAPSFTSSGNISLNNYSGNNVYIAFVYEGNDAAGTSNDNTTTYELDNIRVSGN